MQIKDVTAHGHVRISATKHYNQAQNKLFISRWANVAEADGIYPRRADCYLQLAERDYKSLENYVLDSHKIYGLLPIYIRRGALFTPVGGPIMKPGQLSLLTMPAPTIATPSLLKTESNAFPTVVAAALSVSLVSSTRPIDMPTKEPLPTAVEDIGFQPAAVNDFSISNLKFVISGVSPTCNMSTEVPAYNFNFSEMLANCSADILRGVIRSCIFWRISRSDCKVFSMSEAVLSAIFAAFCALLALSIKSFRAFLKFSSSVFKSASVASSRAFCSLTDFSKLILLFSNEWRVNSCSKDLPSSFLLDRPSLSVRAISFSSLSCVCPISLLRPSIICSLMSWLFIAATISTASASIKISSPDLATVSLSSWRDSSPVHLAKILKSDTDSIITPSATKTDSQTLTESQNDPRAVNDAISKLIDSHRKAERFQEIELVGAAFIFLIARLHRSIQYYMLFHFRAFNVAPTAGEK